MIVICTQCQAKFRVADEKIGPRGAKVRCSKCQTVFVVQRPAPAAPASDAPPPPRSSPPLDVDLEAAPPPPAAPAYQDPFAQAAPQADPFAARPDDPFLAAALAGRASPAPDPFAPSRASDAAPAADDPFAAAPRAEPGIPPDLGLALEDRVTPPAFAAPGAAAALDAGAFDPAGPSAFDPAGPSAFDPAGPGGFDGGFAFGGAGELALATDDTPARPPPLPPRSETGGGAANSFGAPWGAPLPDAAPRAPEPELHLAGVGSIPLPPDPDAAPERPAPGGRAQRAVVPAAAPDRIPGRRGSRVRSVAVNAFALAALLVVALAMRVAWRGGRLDAKALRPSAIVGALHPASADTAPFAAADVRNGLYEREKAPPVLFVRGTVVAGARAPTVRAVRVSVELVRDGAVLGRGDASAGAVPTPEELWSAADDAALSAVAARAAARAPRAVRAGDAVPFLVALPEYPTDLAGVAVRVALEPRP